MAAGGVMSLCTFRGTAICTGALVLHAELGGR